MNLNDLSAEDLARIDSICLAFESKVREGETPSIENFVTEFSGDYAELLRQELLAIQHELDEVVRPRPIRQPFSIETGPASSSGESLKAPVDTAPPEAVASVTHDLANDANAIASDNLEDGSTAEPENIPTGEPKDTASSELEDTATSELEDIASSELEGIASSELEDIASSELEGIASSELEGIASSEHEDIASSELEDTASDELEVLASDRLEDAGSEMPSAAAIVDEVVEPISTDATKPDAEDQESASHIPSDTDDRHRKTPSHESSEVEFVSSDDDETVEVSVSRLLMDEDFSAAPEAEAEAEALPLPYAPRVRDEVLMLLPQEGAMIGPYKIGSTIGKGGMGVVYSATDMRLNRLVAIKVLSVRGNQRDELTERFEREAKAVAALSHPNIVELFDVGVDNGLPYAVMEYLDGESLVDRLERAPISASETRRMGAQICDALAAAHQGGVIHRDLKPHNVMLIRRSGGDDSDFIFDDSSTTRASDSDDSAMGIANESTIVKLVDFGLSRVYRDGVLEYGMGEDEQTTREGMILGTPGYMAPEQARGDTVTAAADIFSLGCILFEAFYGKPAITGETIADRFASTLEGTPAPEPIRRRDDVALADLIDECLRKTPADRPASAVDLAVRLRSTGSRVDRVTERIELGYATGEMLRRRFLTATAGGLVGAVVGGLAAPNHTHELMSIKRLTVLSFQDASRNSKSTEHGRYVAPLADQDLQRGDKLAALLVNELSRLQSVAVTPFRPMVASDTSEFVNLGDQLGVDAFVTGNYRMETQGTAEFVHLSLSIVSAQSGVHLWGKTIVSDASDNLLEQTKLAEEVASAIGHGLTSSASAAKPLNVESFNCLVDGKLRADPDSVAGLETALKCLEDAKNVDISYADPHAGIALTSITLAAQSDPEKTAALILKAREEIAFLEQLGGGILKSIDARLANAMLNWQTLHRYSQAENEINELAMIAPNNWQVQHQRGLLLLTLGRQTLARQAFKEAKLLYPMSAILKIDLARAEWFSGKVERAKNDARIVLARVPCPFAKGLLIDIYENQQDWEAASKMQAEFPRPESRRAYFNERATRLAQQPYGPFGSALNEAIFRLRSKGQMDDSSLAQLAELQSPMLPLLLAAHPAFSATQLLQRAQEMLPKELTGRTF